MKWNDPPNHRLQQDAHRIFETPKIPWIVCFGGFGVRWGPGHGDDGRHAGPRVPYIQGIFWDQKCPHGPMASHGHNWWLIGFERILQVCQGIFPHFWTTPPRNQIPSPTKDGTLHRKAKPSKSALPWCLGQYSEFSCNCFITCHLIIKSYMIIN